MHPNLLLTFIEITGLPKEYILHQCNRLHINNQTILEFYMTYRRFPTEWEAEIISDIGLANFNFLKSEGL